MPIRRRGTVYQVEIRLGRDPRNRRWIKQAATFDTLAEARVAEKKMLARAERLRQAHVTPSCQRLEEYLAGWFERKRDEGLKAKTIYDYERISQRLIVPAFLGVRLADLTPVMVQRWQDALAKRAADRGAAQAAYAHRILRAALNDAVRLGHIEANPAARARAALRSPRKREGFTLQEAEAIFSAARGSAVEPLLRFALYSGLRRGEIAGLKWADIDQDSRTISVRRARVNVGGGVLVTTPKTAKGVRTFTLPALAAQALDLQRTQQERDSAAAATAEWNPGGWVFTTRLGTPRDPSNIGRAFRAVRSVAGVRPLPLYSLRHAAASVFLGAGVPLGVAAKMMGHSQVATFADTYADLLQEASKEAARQVDAFLANRATPSTPSSAAQGAARRRGRPRSTDHDHER